MDDKKQEKTEIKKSKVDKDKGKNPISSCFKDIFSEFRKVTWPSRQEVIKSTGVVIVTCAIFGVIISVFDFALAWLYQSFVKLFN